MGNGFLGKIFRLVGFLAVGLAAAVGIIYLLDGSTLNFGGAVDDIFTTVMNLVDPTLAVYVFFGGISLLIWTLGKTIVGKLLLQVITLAVLLVELKNFDLPLLGVVPTFTLFDLSFLDFITSYIAVGAYLAFVLLIWILAFKRRPKRSSVSALRFGMFLMFFFIIFQFLLTGPLASVSFLTTSTFTGLVYPIMHSFVLLFFVISGLLGFLSMFAK